jgi:predicted membrane channel-forming protein YqfA (hemolysin III family)
MKWLVVIVYVLLLIGASNGTPAGDRLLLWLIVGGVLFLFGLVIYEGAKEAGEEGVREDDAL